MRKIISLFLCALILFSCAVVSFAQDNEEELNIAVASDLHYNLPREELEHTIDDEIYWYANRRAAMEDESGYIIDEFLNQCAEDDSVDCVFISGDLADNGRVIREEHENVAAKLKAFEEKTGKSVFVTNGNHDTGAAESDFGNDDFREVYADFGFNEAIATATDALSYTADLNDKYRLIVADSCDPTVSTEDGLTSKRVNWICNQAAQAHKDGKYPILMMHHNLLEHMPAQRVLSHNFIVRNHRLTAEKLADSGIKVVFTGHEHGSDVTSYTSARGNVITDFSTTSLTMFPLAYRYVSFAENFINYESRSIDTIDTDALTSAVNGYTDEHISLINSDLSDYSKNFFKTSIEYRLSLALTPEKLGVATDKFYSDIVYTAVNGLTDILEKPLYGENSVSELASEYNIEIPESDYENGWDLVSEIVSYHYSGNEPFALDSTEVVMILRIADLILLDVLSSVNDKTFLKLANDIISDFGTDSVCKDFSKAAAKTLGPVTAGEYFIVAVASPILYGLAYDSDGIDDNNGSIAGYGVNNNSENIKNNISGFFERIKLYISFFLTYILKIFRIG